jgi:hypothetical protein
MMTLAMAMTPGGSAPRRCVQAPEGSARAPSADGLSGRAFPCDFSPTTPAQSVGAKDERIGDFVKCPMFPSWSEPFTRTHLKW